MHRPGGRGPGAGARYHGGMSVDELSSAAQDYLKLIWSATEWTDQPMTVSRLAERLGIRPATASDGIRRLTAQGLVEHRPYGSIELTEEGRRHAIQMVRRHRLLETFLVDVLGYGWDEVHDEAELLEHTVSDAFVERLDVKLGRPRRDPHGDPIPTSDGSVHYPVAHRLDQLDDGHPGRLVRVSDADPAVLRLLDRHGIGLDDDLLARRGEDTVVAVRRDVPGAPDLPLEEGLAGALWIESTSPHEGCTVLDGER